METMEKNQSKMKETLTEMKNNLQRIKSTVEKGISSFFLSAAKNSIV